MATLNKAGSFDKAKIRPADISAVDKNWTIGGLQLTAGEMSFKEGTTERFKITSAGTVSHGKAQVEKLANESGLVMYSPAKKWKIEVSDTGQIIATETA